MSHIIALSVLAEVRYCAGDLAEAKKIFLEVEKLAIDKVAYRQVLWSLSMQTEIQLASGGLACSLVILERAENFAVQANISGQPVMEVIYRLRSKILLELYRLDEAETQALKGLNCVGSDRDKVQCASVVLKIALLRGQPEQAKYYSTLMLNILDSANELHPDWLSTAYSALLEYWEKTGDLMSIDRVLSHIDFPSTAPNHFSQSTGRNYIVALLLLGRTNDLEAPINTLLYDAKKHGLVLDHSQALIFAAVLHWKTGRKDKAVDVLKEALCASLHSGMLFSWVRFAEDVLHLLSFSFHLLKKNSREYALALRIRQLICSIPKFRHVTASLEQEPVLQELAMSDRLHGQVVGSALTKREWQILELLYLGLTNEQISNKLFIAETTVKTHVRNIYQKLHVGNRKEAIVKLKEMLRD